MHLISFPTKKEHKRALMTLLEVPRGEFLGLPDFQMVVTEERRPAFGDDDDYDDDNQDHGEDDDNLSNQNPDSDN